MLFPGVRRSEHAETAATSPSTIVFRVQQSSYVQTAQMIDVEKITKRVRGRVRR
jgi:hypothetical protein